MWAATRTIQRLAMTTVLVGKAMVVAAVGKRLMEYHPHCDLSVSAAPDESSKWGRTGYWNGWLQMPAPHAILCIAQWTLRPRINLIDFGP